MARDGVHNRNEAGILLKHGIETGPKPGGCKNASNLARETRDKPFSNFPLDSAGNAFSTALNENSFP